MATDATPVRWRTELPFLVTLVVAAALRVLIVIAFPPAFLMSDAPTYLAISDHLAPSPDRPIGYSIFLRGVSDATRSLELVTSLQAVLGLLTAVAAYALLRRWGVRPWVATLATVPTLFDSMQLLLEHTILSDVLFGFLLVAGVAALAWWPTPRWWTTVVAGALFGLATLVRILGEPIIVLAALFLLLVATSWRTRLLHVALVVVAFAVPVSAYAAWYHHENGAWAITQASGRALYMRTTTFVDCRTLQVPDYERVLCPDDPLSDRQDPTWYGWHSQETIPRLHPPPGVTVRQAMRDFAIRAIEAQPGDYARDVARDFSLAFIGYDRGNHYEMSTSVKWTFAHYVDYQATPDWTRPAFEAHGGRLPGTNQPMADVMAWYGRFVFLTGPLALALVVLAAVGILVRRRRDGPSLRPLALLTLALPLMLILIPDVTAQFVWRYQLPLVLVLPLSAALGWTRLRPPTGAPRSDDTHSREPEPHRVPAQR
ncbi:MAG TPA: phospholipid carrier-dependent glycosyltransferase [Nocardioides sp.]|uniref:phospholipid carrier-dependent glycosyltransferase n=1 Tax=Nocardioides sp. TaxID=35761 RepID=UPI002F42DA7D